MATTDGTTIQATRHRGARADLGYRETFDNIYLDLSKHTGKCRFAESGLGWKPSGPGDTFTLDKAEIIASQWSKAARGFEVKIYSRNSGVIQLDGFQLDVRLPVSACASLGTI